MRWCLLESSESGVLFSALAFLVAALRARWSLFPVKWLAFLFFLDFSASEFITWHELNEMQPNSSRVKHFLKLWSLPTLWVVSAPITGSRLIMQNCWPFSANVPAHRTPTSAQTHSHAGPTQAHPQASTLAHLASTLAPSPVQSSTLKLYSNRVPKRLICQFNFKCFALQEYFRP